MNPQTENYLWALLALIIFILTVTVSWMGIMVLDEQGFNFVILFGIPFVFFFIYTSQPFYRLVLRKIKTNNKRKWKK